MGGSPRATVTNSAARGIHIRNPPQRSIAMRTLSIGLLAVLTVPVPSPAAEPKASTPSASGTLTVDGKKYTFTSALAYNKKASGKTRTVVYLTEKPLDTTKLKQSLKKDGTDDGFSVFEPHVELIFDDKGALFQTVMYAEGKTVNEIGSDDIKGAAKLGDGKATGKANTEKPIKAFGGSMAFDATFDVKLTAP
jgi:hypothetical protein